MDGRVRGLSPPKRAVWQAAGMVNIDKLIAEGEPMDAAAFAATFLTAAAHGERWTDLTRGTVPVLTDWTPEAVLAHNAWMAAAGALVEELRLAGQDPRPLVAKALQRLPRDS